MATATYDFSTSGVLPAPWTNVRSSYTSNGTTASPTSLTGDDVVSLYTAVPLATVGNDQYAQVAIVTVTGGSAGDGAGPGVLVRFANTFDPTGYRCVVNAAATNNVDLSQFDATAHDYLNLGFATKAFASGDILRLEVTGQNTATTLTVKHAPAATPTVFTTIMGPITDTSGVAVNSGLVGLGYSTILTAAALDNWEGGDLAVASGAGLSAVRLIGARARLVGPGGLVG